jgi:hypothetical protein
VASGVRTFSMLAEHFGHFIDRSMRLRSHSNERAARGSSDRRHGAALPCAIGPG